MNLRFTTKGESKPDLRDYRLNKNHVNLGVGLEP